jgi:hypothetical protein
LALRVEHVGPWEEGDGTAADYLGNWADRVVPELDALGFAVPIGDGSDVR